MGLAELLISRRAAGLALIAVTVLGLAASASCTYPAGQSAADVVATVGTAQVTVAEVSARLPAEDTGPPVVRPGVAPLDAWREALHRAIRDELLSLEAAARDPGASWAPDPAGRAARIQMVVDQERRDTPGLRPSEITDAEARAWLTRNHRLFDEIEGAHATWATLADADRARARAMLDAAVGLDRAGFLALAGEYGASTGSATLDDSGDGADANVARVAFAVRATGSVGMLTAEDRSWIVRVDSVEVSTPPWNDGLAGRVRAAMAWEREQAHLDSLAARLESRWPVAVDEQRFAASRP